MRASAGLQGSGLVEEAFGEPLASSQNRSQHSMTSPEPHTGGCTGDTAMDFKG
jgi:hypothetical protein